MLYLVSQCIPVCALHLNAVLFGRSPSPVVLTFLHTAQLAKL